MSEELINKYQFKINFYNRYKSDEYEEYCINKIIKYEKKLEILYDKTLEFNKDYIYNICNDINFRPINKNIFIKYHTIYIETYNESNSRLANMFDLDISIEQMILLGNLIILYKNKSKSELNILIKILREICIQIKLNKIELIEQAKRYATYIINSDANIVLIYEILICFIINHDSIIPIVDLLLLLPNLDDYITDIMNFFVDNQVYDGIIYLLDKIDYSQNLKVLINIVNYVIKNHHDNENLLLKLNDIILKCKLEINELIICIINLYINKNDNGKIIEYFNKLNIKKINNKVENDQFDESDDYINKLINIICYIYSKDLKDYCNEIDTIIKCLIKIP